MRILIFIILSSLLMCVMGINASVMLEDIVGAWLFEGIGGDIVKDMTGNGHDGKIMGNPKVVAGKYGSGLEFDGTDDYVEVTHSEELNLETFTLAAWIKMGNTGTEQNVIVKKFNDPEQKTFQLLSHTGSNGAMRGSFHVGGTNKVVMGQTPVTDDEWHHTATTYDGTTLKIYLDGELEAEAAAAGIPDKTEAPLGLGSACPGQFMKGIIDEACAIKTALEQEEIKEIMNGLNLYLAVKSRGKLAATWAEVKD